MLYVGLRDEQRQEDLNSKLFLNFRKSSLLLFILYKIYSFIQQYYDLIY